MALYDRPYALGSVALLLPFFLLIRYRQRKNQLNLPCAGSGWRTPSFLLPIVSLFWARDLIEDVYNKHKSEDQPQPYLLPGILGNEVMLPTSWIPWLASKPEAILSGKWSRIQRMNFDTTFMRGEVVTNPIQEAVIRRDLIANLDKLAPELADEIAAAVDELWGCDVKNYKIVSLDDTIFRIIARTSSRIFAGKTISRDATFIDNSIRFAMVVITSGFIKTVIPKPLEPLLVRLLVSYVRWHYTKLSQVLEPLFQRTNAKQPYGDLKEIASPDGEYKSDTAVQWLTANATRDPSFHPKERTPSWLALRLTTLLFAAVDTTSLTSINALLDIFTEGVDGNCAASLREEARHNTEIYGARWDRARLNSMPCHDSALRESMRLSGFAVKILQRKVMAPEGIALPNGTILPQGTMVCVSAWGLHHDEQVYSRPEEFLPNRFMVGRSRSSQERDSELRKPSDRESVLLRTAAEADTAFTFWGLGKQSCPGRYVAVDLIKILMEYVVMNYDVVPLKRRPANMWIEYNYVPSKAKLQVRRRRIS